MKQILLFLIANLVLITTSFGDEFVIKSFKKLDSKILTNENKVYDDNDELCAIILVRTAVVDLGISTSTPMVGNMDWVEGDYKVVISAGTRMIKFFKKGFETLEYTFPQRPEKGIYYLLELEYRKTEAISSGNSMGFVLINSSPQGANVFINGESTGMKTPFQNPYNEGYYKFELQHSQYLNYNGDFTISANETMKVDATLSPNFGKLKLTYYPINEVIVNVDGKRVSGSSPLTIDKLSPGEHTITLDKYMYDSHKQSFNINRKETTELSIEMTPNFGGLNLIVSPPEDITIGIDGSSYTTQNSPYNNKELSPGNHTIEISKNLYETYSTDFIIEKGSTTNLNATLTPTFGSIEVTVNENATIFIDNQEKGKGEYNGTLLKGAHIVEVRKDKYTAQTRQVTIEVGSLLTEEFTLQPKLGVLSIMTTPPEVSISLDGVPKGTSPKFINDLLVGNYNLTLSKSGYNTYNKNITVSENRTLTINETLSEKITETIPKKSGETQTTKNSNTGNKSTLKQGSPTSKNIHDKYSASKAKFGIDSSKCILNLSLYKEFFKQWKTSKYKNNAIYDAYPQWQIAFNICPRSSQNMYIDGAKMIEYKHKKITDLNRKNELEDSLMLVFDRRLKYFPTRKDKSQKGYILSRKGVALYQLNSTKYKEAFNYLDESIKLLKEDSKFYTFVYYARSIVKSAKNGQLDKAKAKELITAVLGYIDLNIKKYANNTKKIGEYNNAKLVIKSEYDAL